MAKIRKDNKGRNLHVRESQRADGRYLYTYMLNGKRKYIYDTDLHRLREKERQIEQDLHDGIRATRHSNSPSTTCLKPIWQPRTH